MSASIGLTASPARRRFLPRPGTLLIAACAVVIVVVAVLACFGPMLAPHDPTMPNLIYANVGRTPGHPLGFDGQGHDLLSRLLAGARTAVLAPLAITVMAVVAGSILAVTAAWCGGWVDAVISAVVDLIFSFPGMLLAILAAAVFGRGITAPVIALGIAYTPYLARVLRSAALRERMRNYVVACELQGLSGFSVCARHLLPNIASVVVAQGSLVFGYAIADFAAISYLGLGVQAPASDWGVMVSDGQDGLLQGYPMESLSAGVLIVAVVVAVNLLGERLVQDEELRQ